MRRAMSGWLTTLGCLLLACGGEKVEDTTAVVRVELAPESALLRVGDELRLEAKAYDARGGLVRGADVTFRSSAPDVAKVDADGVVRALHPGAAVVTASVGKKWASMALRVRPPVHAISIEPDPVELSTEESIQLGAIAFDENGDRIEGVEFAWGVEEERVATITPEGLLTARRREDVTRVFARADGVEGKATVVVRKKVHAIEIRPPSLVLRVGQEQRLEAIARDDGGVALEGRAIAWSSSDEEIATVDETGLVRAVAVGTAKIAARHGEVEAAIDVEVRPVRVHRLVIEPSEVELVVGESVRFSVRAYDADGNELFGRPLVWSVEDLDLEENTYARIAAELDEEGWLVARRPLNGKVVVAVPGDGVSAEAHVRIVLRLVAVSAGQFHTCGLDAAGRAWCWGRAREGQTGRPPSSDLIPAPVETELRFRALAAGASHTCGLTEAGEAHCWGENEFGQLGNGETGEPTFRPVGVAHPAHAGPFTAIYAGDAYTCAIDDEGAAYCWGYNDDGRLGDGTTTPASTPQRVRGEAVDGEEVPIAFRALALGSNPSASPMPTFTCGISEDGVTYCWGRNETEAFGIGAGEDVLASTTPVRVASEARFDEVSVGARHACARTAEGEVHCWGRGAWGELGDGEFTPIPGHPPHARSAPQPVATDARYRLLAVAHQSTCALTLEGEIHCWGRMPHTDETWAVPRALLTGGETWAFERVDAGSYHYCAIDADRAVSCWGSNLDGQVGNPDEATIVAAPVRIFPE